MVRGVGSPRSIVSTYNLSDCDRVGNPEFNRKDSVSCRSESKQGSAHLRMRLRVNDLADAYVGPADVDRPARLLGRFSFFTPIGRS